MSNLLVCKLISSLLLLSKILSQASEEVLDDLQTKKVSLPIKRIRLDVEFVKKNYTFEKLPILNFQEIKGKDIEGCEIVQGQLLEVLPAQMVVDRFPVGMDKRWYSWLRYSDAQFFIFREDKYSKINCVRFSRTGQTLDFWNIDYNVIKGKEAKDLLLLQDTGEETGPGLSKPGTTYLYVAPKTVVYHEMNFLGRTVKSKVYTLDYDLSLIDATVLNKKYYLINTYAMIRMTINADKITKDEEIIIPPNLISQIGITLGEIFLFVMKDKDGYSLVANSRFHYEGCYTHLKGKNIKIRRSGNRRYVFFVQEDAYEGKGTYYFLLNPGVKKPSSLVFERVPEIADQYQLAFEMSDRIHFIKENKHVMFTKGSKKSLIKYVNNAPLLGMVYWSTNQYLSEDKFLSVVDMETRGILKVSSVVLTSPIVLCLPRLGAVERYEKFSVFNKLYEYRFDVVFHNTGNEDFQAGTIFQILCCTLGGIAVVALLWVCVQQHINDKQEQKLNVILKQKKRLEGNYELDRGITIKNRLNKVENDDSGDFDDDGEEDHEISNAYAL